MPSSPRRNASRSVSARSRGLPSALAAAFFDVFGFVGRWEDRKGIRELAEAWPRVAEALPDAHLLREGTGVVLDATFDLIPIESSRCIVDTTRAADLDAYGPGRDAVTET